MAAFSNSQYTTRNYNFSAYVTEINIQEILSVLSDIKYPNLEYIINVNDILHFVKFNNIDIKNVIKNLNVKTNIYNENLS